MGKFHMSRFGVGTFRVGEFDINKFQKLLLGVLACAIAACLTLTGCAFGASVSSNPEELFIGTWEIESLVQDGEEITADEIDAMRDYLNTSVYLILDENGDATLDLFGETAEGQWEVIDEGSCSITIEGSSVTATLSDDVLTFSQDESEMHFTQIDPDDRIVSS